VDDGAKRSQMRSESACFRGLTSAENLGKERGETDMAYWLAGCVIVAVAAMFLGLRAAAARADRRREARNFETDSLLHSIGPVEFEATPTHAPEIETEPMVLTPPETEPTKGVLGGSRR
jgi:hypothetical protein